MTCCCHSDVACPCVCIASCYRVTSTVFERAMECHGCTTTSATHCIDKCSGGGGREGERGGWSDEGGKEDGQVGGGGGRVKKSGGGR